MLHCEVSEYSLPDSKKFFLVLSTSLFCFFFFFLFGLSSHEKHPVFSPQLVFCTYWYGVTYLNRLHGWITAVIVLPFNQNGSPLFSVHRGTYCGAVCGIWCLCRASHSSVLWMRWPPTLTSVPCKAGNEVSSTTTEWAELPGTTNFCCVLLAVWCWFPNPQWHATHTSVLWKNRPLTQASVGGDDGGLTHLHRCDLGV